MKNSLCLVAIAFLTVSSFAFSHENESKDDHKDHGACKLYLETCKNDSTVTSAADKKAKHIAIRACIAAAATADLENGKACLDKMTKSKK